MPRRLTYEYVKEYIESFGHKLLSKEYKNCETKLRVKCPKEHEYEVTFHNFKNGSSRCPKCAKIKYTIDDVKKYVEKQGYKLLSDKYEEIRDRIMVQCPNGHIYEVQYSCFLGNSKRKGNRCAYCNGNGKLSYEYVKEQIEKVGYKLLSNEYINSRRKLLIQCNKGHEYEATFPSFQNGRRCPICNISNGERKIMKWLDDSAINYIYEKMFYGLIGLGGRNLSYDFYLPNYNLLIEYQGEFHDGTVTGNHKYIFDLEKQQEHDRRKREYAENNGYELLEIWYWDFDNIEKILEKEIKGGE